MISEHNFYPISSFYFCPASVYLLLTSIEPRANYSKIWDQIWKLKVPQRIRMFIWLINHGKLLTNLERNRRGFTVDPFCKHCPNIIKDLDHVFRKCIKVKPLCAKLADETDLRSTQDMNDEWKDKFSNCLWWA